MELLGTMLILIWFLWTAITVTQSAVEVEKARDRKNKIAMFVFTTISPIIIAVPFIVLYKFVEVMIV